MNVRLLQPLYLMEHYFLQRLLLVTVFLLFTFGVKAQSVTSDKDDYAPGEVAVITGSGWLQDSLVDVHFEEEPAHDHHHGYHGTVVNPDGTWRIEYPIEDRHLGTAFTVIVVGQQSGTEARAYFTDAPSIIEITPGTGEASGNTEVTIKGRGIIVDNWSLEVKFGEINATVKPNSAVIEGTGSKQLHSITVYAPAQAAGIYEVKVIMTKIIGSPKVEESNSLPYTYTKSAASLSISGLSHIYDGTPKTIVVTTSPPGLSGVKVTYNGSATAPSAAGSYTVSATLDNPGYMAAMVTETMVIAKAPARVSLEGLMHTYDAAAKSATASTDASGQSAFIITYDGLSELPVNHKPGGYAVVATLVNDNYVGSASGTLFINKAGQVIQWPAPAGITYGTALSPVQLNASLTTGNGALTYKPALGTILDAGERTLSATAAETNNYLQNTASVSINVAKATPTLALEEGGPYTYDGSAKSVRSASVTGVGGTQIAAASIIYKKGGVLVAAPVDAGRYEVVASFAGNDNYHAVEVTGALVIQKASLSIKADDAARMYGDNNPVFTGSTVEGAVPGEVFVVTASTAATNISDIGDYAIVPSVAGPTIHNYTVTVIDGTLSVRERPITVTADAGLTKVYGEANPASYSFGVTSGSLVDAAHLTGALERHPGENVGSYALTQGTLAATANYALTFIGADFTITKRRVEVTADARSKVYGYNDPELSYTVTSGSLVYNDAFTGSLNRSAGENIGAYVVDLGTLSLGNNYNLSFAQGPGFSITPRAVTVTADAKSKIAGTADPSLTYNVTVGALVEKDGFSGSLTRKYGEQKGEYAISQGDLSLSSNYALNFIGANLTIFNPASVTLTGSGPVEINSNSSITSAFVGDVFEPVWSFEAAPVVSVSQSHLVLTSPVFKVYTVTLTYKDGVGTSFTTEPAYAVFFDPNAGFVTGGGWIISPEGAYKPLNGSEAYVSPSGKATFGFVSKYEKGAKLPTGNTEFQYHLGGMQFKSTAYEWLNVAGARAQYKGSGTINGSGDYGFMLTAVDGQVSGGGNVDRFRIKIWSKSSGVVVYDNQLGAADDADLTTALGGGSIVVHQVSSVKGGSTSGKVVAASAVAPGSTAGSFLNYPNPYSDKTTIAISFEREERFGLVVYDVKGAVVKRFAESVAEAGQVYSYELSAENLPEGMYFARLTTSQGVKTIKMVLNR